MPRGLIRRDNIDLRRLHFAAVIAFHTGATDGGRQAQQTETRSHVGGGALLCRGEYSARCLNGFISVTLVLFVDVYKRAGTR